MVIAEQNTNREVAKMSACCQVVWEGRRRKAAPYPDRWHIESLSGVTHDRLDLIADSSSSTPMTPSGQSGSAQLDARSIAAKLLALPLERHRSGVKKGGFEIVSFDDIA